MAGDPSIRIGDDDREDTIGVLRQAYAEGRLDLAEFEERVQRVEGATFGHELVTLTADLPKVGEATSPTPTASAKGSAFRKEYSIFIAAPIICTAIWAMTDFGGTFWPMWVWFGCGAVILMGVLSRD